jgi:GNAT superfamily N-acetyltransferase
MSPGASLVVIDEPTIDDAKVVEAGLLAYNVEQARPYDRRPLAVFLRDAGGGTVGGVTGYTNWGWLYLDIFWLPDELRASGWGSRILAAAEEEARRRGCHFSRLFTYTFQAPGFYEKHGYTVFGELKDYPPGHSQIWMRKSLDAPGSEPS